VLLESGIGEGLEVPVSFSSFHNGEALFRYRDSCLSLIGPLAGSLAEAVHSLPRNTSATNDAFTSAATTTQPISS
jgi:hypothetical protein